MSDTTDDMEALSGLYELYLEREAEIIENKIWIMRSGKKIRVSDMETSHIENSLNMIKRKKATSTSLIFVKIFEDELKSRKQS